MTRITDAIHDLGVEVESSEMLRRRNVHPFNHFLLGGTDEMSAESDE